MKRIIYWGLSGLLLLFAVSCAMDYGVDDFMEETSVVGRWNVVSLNRTALSISNGDTLSETNRIDDISVPSSLIFQHSGKGWWEYIDPDVASGNGMLLIHFQWKENRDSVRMIYEGSNRVMDFRKSVADYRTLHLQTNYSPANNAAEAIYHDTYILER